MPVNQYTKGDFTMLNLPANFETYAEARKAGFMKMKEIKDNGGRIVGVYCSFVPQELLMAAGAAAAGPTARWKGYYMDLDWRGTEARPGAGYGGTQATPLVCYSIAEARTAGVKIPLYGGGGVFNFENAARILMAGSEMVQLGALACAGGTMACKKLINDLYRWMDENGYADMDSLVGDSLKLFQMDADFTKKRQNKLADAYQTADADRTKCIGCGRCEDVCWHQGIEIKDRKAYKTDKCIGCGYCFQVCPTEALYVDKKGILRSAFEEAGIERGNK